MRASRVDVVENRLQRRAADGVEVHVDAVGTGSRQFGIDAHVAVDGVVVAQLVDQALALVGSGGDTDGPSSADPGDLAGHRPDGSAGRADHDGFSRLWLADIGHAEVRGHPRVAEDAEVPVRRAVVVRGHDDEEVCRVGDRVLLPREPSPEVLTGSEIGVMRFDDAAQCLSDDRRVERHCRHDVVTAAFVHPVAKSCVERDEQVLHEHLPVC